MHKGVSGHVGLDGVDPPLPSEGRTKESLLFSRVWMQDRGSHVQLVLHSEVPGNWLYPVTWSLVSASAL